MTHIILTADTLQEIETKIEEMTGYLLVTEPFKEGELWKALLTKDWVCPIWLGDE